MGRPRAPRGRLGSPSAPPAAPPRGLFMTPSPSLAAAAAAEGPARGDREQRWRRGGRRAARGGAPPAGRGAAATDPTCVLRGAARPEGQAAVILPPKFCPSDLWF